MDEYIKRKDAFEILQSRLDSISQMSYLNMDWHELDIMRNAIENAIDDVREVPSSDVQPIKKGHWNHNTSKYISELDAYFIQACCSCCGKYSDRVDLYSTIMSNEMCSHCGARMIKDGDTNG